MGLFGSRHATSVAPDSREDREDIVARYERLRPIRMRLNHTLTGLLSKRVIHEGAKRLGMLRGETVFFENEDQTSVLMDYCIYNVYHNGRNAVEQYLCDSLPDPDSEEMDCLQAMQHATYSMVVVLGVEPGLGCVIRNLFTDETRLLVDMGFSRSARPGLLLATRLLDFDDFLATGGAALPLGILHEDEIQEWQRRISAGVQEDDYDPAPIIRTCLKQGASSHVRYEDAPAPHLSPPRRKYSLGGSQAKRRAEPKQKKPLATRRCRCGSGKMYKNCCGKRRRAP